MSDRFLLLDYLTRDVVCELPAISSMSYTETLNKPGNWSVSLPITSEVLAADLYSSRAIFVFERAEIIRFAGPIITARVNLDSQSINLNGEGPMNFLKRRVLWSNKTYTNTDQLLIVKDLIDYAQNTFGTPGNLGITTTALTAITTVNRTKNYYYYEHKLIGELIEQLAEIQDGFDFRITPRWSDGPNSTLVYDFGVTFPKTGRQTGYVFDVNAVDFSTIDVDLSRLAFQAVATGNGTGENIPFYVRSNSSKIPVNALLEDVVSVGDEPSVATLGDYAYRRLSLGQVPLIYPNVILDPSFIGSFIPGDQVRCLGNTGVLDIGGTYRIVEQSFSLDAEGPESISIKLAPLAAWSI